MKRYLFLLIVLMVSVSSFAQYDAEYYYSHRQYALSGSRTTDPIYLGFAELGGSSLRGTGKVFYVDSGVSNEGNGESWTTAKNTLDEAIDLCTDDRGDIIYVAQGHAENLSGAGTVTCDKSGVTIIGCGKGDLRPLFTTTGTAGTFLVSDNAVTVYNLRFVPGISAVVTGISVAATGDAFALVGCQFESPGTATYEYISMITLASGADYVTITGNKAVSTVSTTGCVNFLTASAGVVNRLCVTDNDIQGNFITTGAIYSNQINTNMLIANNTILNTATGVPCINLTGASTGFAINNTLYADTFGTAGITILDPGSLVCSNNRAINTTDKSSIVIPPLPALTTQSLTAGSWEDILNKMYYASDGTGAYPATVANDSALAMILAKGATATASTYSNTTDSLEAISDAVRTSYESYTNPNYFAVTTGTFDTTGTWSTAAAHEIAVVTGMVKMTIITECTASVSSASDTGTIALGDETNTASLIAASTLGSGVMVTGELWVDATLTRTVLTQTQINAITFVVAAGKDIGYTVATNALTGGSLKFHIWWTPLDATGNVAAGAGGAF